MSDVLSAINELPDEEIKNLISEARKPEDLVKFLDFVGEEFYGDILASEHCDITCLKAMWEKFDIDSVNLYWIKELVAHQNVTQELMEDICEKCKTNTSAFSAYLWGRAKSPNTTSKDLAKLWGALDDCPEYSHCRIKGLHLLILSNPNLRYEDVLSLDVSKEDDTILRMYEEILARVQN